MTLNEFIQENRDGLRTPFPVTLCEEERKVALAYVLKKPLIVQGWLTGMGTGVYDHLRYGFAPWHRVGSLRFVWPSGASYSIDFECLLPVEKRRLRTFYKKWHHYTGDSVDALNQTLHLLGYELVVKRTFESLLMANVSF